MTTPRWLSVSGPGQLEQLGQDRADAVRAAPSHADYEKHLRLRLPRDVPMLDMRAALDRYIVVPTIDHSGSTTGTDPNCCRLAAARTVVDLLSRCGPKARVGLVPWGQYAPAQLAVAPQEVRRNKRALMDSLRAPHSLGGTDVSKALRRVARLVPQLAASEHLAVLVITDGYSQFDAETVAAVQALPAHSVHLLLIDVTGDLTDSYQQAWQQLPLGSIRRLSHDNPRLMQWEVGDTLMSAAGFSLPPLQDRMMWRAS